MSNLCVFLESILYIFMHGLHCLVFDHLLLTFCLHRLIFVILKSILFTFIYTIYHL